MRIRRLFWRRKARRDLNRLRRVIPDDWITPDGNLEPKIESAEQARQMVIDLLGKDDPIAKFYLARFDAIEQEADTETKSNPGRSSDQSEPPTRYESPEDF